MREGQWLMILEQIAPTEGRHDRTTPSEKLVSGVIEGQLSEVERLAPLVRAGDDPEAVHDMRVAVRRLRITLRSLQAVLRTEWVGAVRSELEWIGDRLGIVRDLDVLWQRLRLDADRLDGGDAVVATTLLHPLNTEQRDRREAMFAALDSERFRNLLEVLRAASRRPPTRRDDVSPKRLARKEFRRLRKRGEISPSLSAAALHKRRIRVKRVRYTAELCGGSKAKKVVRDAKHLQDVLGDHHDAIVARRRLRDLARVCGRADTGLVAGRLIELQEARIEQALDELPSAWKRFRRTGI